MHLKKGKKENSVKLKCCSFNRSSPWSKVYLSDFLVLVLVLVWTSLNESESLLPRKLWNFEKEDSAVIQNIDRSPCKKNKKCLISSFCASVWVWITGAAVVAGRPSVPLPIHLHWLLRPEQAQRSKLSGLSWLWQRSPSQRFLQTPSMLQMFEVCLCGCESGRLGNLRSNIPDYMWTRPESPLCYGRVYP